ncbi:hypothetical protein HQM25_14030 [Microbacterium hominis]|uniref:WXG100 family type VII secretion target n=2 Tax=Microbacterium hominis TaxID=162426 RepID=A0A7D4UGY7_9MICO|nr:hypothetical protein HQM25_14030 [Microbacterium hominis]
MIRLDLAAIGATARRARRIRTVFDTSDDSARRAAEACGHDELAGTVERFASTWDDRRRGMSDSLGTLAGVLDEIHDAFSQLDRSLGGSGV